MIVFLDFLGEQIVHILRDNALRSLVFVVDTGGNLNVSVGDIEKMSVSLIRWYGNARIIRLHE